MRNIYDTLLKRIDAYRATCLKLEQRGAYITRRVLMIESGNRVRVPVGVEFRCRDEFIVGALKSERQLLIVCDSFLVAYTGEEGDFGNPKQALESLGFDTDPGAPQPTLTRVGEDGRLRIEEPWIEPIAEGSVQIAGELLGYVAFSTNHGV